MKLAVMILLVGACGGGSGDSDEPGAPELGTGDHSPSSVTFTTIAAPEAPLQDPRDLAFNPLRPDELWVVNHDDDSVLIVHEAPSDNRQPERRKDGYALHFMAEVTALDSSPRPRSPLTAPLLTLLGFPLG